MEELLNNLTFRSVIWQLVTPLIFSLADIIVGYIQALINKTIDSKIMRTGLLHKCLLIVAICLGYVVEFAFGIATVAKTITIYICLMEAISILENLSKAGVDLGKLGEILNINENTNHKGEQDYGNKHTSSRKF